jgi:hypothetical protein
MESRSTQAICELDDLIGLVGYLANAASDEQALLAEVTKGCEGGSAARFSRIRPLWTKWEEAAERSGRSLTVVHCGIILGETLALCSPEEFLIRRSSLDRTVVLPSIAIDLMVVIASRERLAMGGLSATEEAPVLISLMRSARRSGMGATDFTSPLWARWGLANHGKWVDVDLGSAPQLLSDVTPTLVFINPGPGRISIGLPMVGLLTAGILAALYLRSTPYISDNKRFDEVHAANPKMDGKAVVSIDLDDDEDRIHAATDGAGVVTVDLRDYSTRKTPGLSSQVIKDVVALKGGGYLALTRGRDGSLGLDHVGPNGKVASVHVGLPELDVGQVLAEGQTLDHALEVGDDVLLVLGQELLLYKTANRVLVRVNVPSTVMLDDKILDVAASRRVSSKAWLLLSGAGTRRILEISLISHESPTIATIDIDNLKGLPGRICHDGGRLWCLDLNENLHERTSRDWVLRAGTPSHAAKSGGVRTATLLEVSDLGPDIPAVLWMLKDNYIFARAVPVDEAPSHLPLPWKQVHNFEQDKEFLGKIHAYAVGRTAVLLVPYGGEIKKVSFEPSSGEPGPLTTWIKPTEGYVILSADGAPEGLTICLSISHDGLEGSQVRFLPIGEFPKYVGKEVRDIGTLVQGSLATSTDFNFDTIVGVAQLAGLTHHIDDQGRLLTFATKPARSRSFLSSSPTGQQFEVINGLFADGQKPAPFPWQTLGPDFRVSSAVQSGKEGDSLLVCTTLGLVELDIKFDGILAEGRLLIEQRDSGPDAKLTPISATLAINKPEIFFLGPRSEVDIRPVAEPWQVSSGQDAPAMDWYLSQSGYGGENIGNKVAFLADSLRRLRLPGSNIESLGPLVAVTPDRSLIWRDKSELLWQKRISDATKWSDLGHSVDGLTLARGRISEKDSAAIGAIAVLELNTSGQLIPRMLWEQGTEPSQTPYLSLAVARPNHLLLSPTPSGFVAYKLIGRQWTQATIGGLSPGSLESLAMMAEYSSEGFAKRAWWWSANGKYWGIGQVGLSDSGDIKANILKAEWHGDSAVFLTDSNALNLISLSGEDRVLMGPESANSKGVVIKQIVLADQNVVALGGDGHAYSINGDTALFAKSLRDGLVNLVEVGGEVVAQTFDGDLLLPLTQGETRRAKVDEVYSLGSAGILRGRDGNLLVFDKELGSFWSIGTTSKEGRVSIGPKVSSILEHDGGLFIVGESGILFRPKPTKSDSPLASIPVLGSTEGVDWLDDIGGTPYAYRFVDSVLTPFQIEQVGLASLRLKKMPVVINSPDNRSGYMAKNFALVSTETSTVDNVGGESTMESQSPMAPLGSRVLHLSSSLDGSRLPFLYNPRRGVDLPLAVDAPLPSQRLLSDKATIVATGSPTNSSLLVLDGNRLYRASQSVAAGAIKFSFIEEGVRDVLHVGSGRGVRLREGADGGMDLANESELTPLPVLTDSDASSASLEKLLPMPGTSDQVLTLINGKLLRADTSGGRRTLEVAGSVHDIGMSGQRVYYAQKTAEGLMSLRWSGSQDAVGSVNKLAVASNAMAYRVTTGAYTHKFVCETDGGTLQSYSDDLAVSTSVDLSAAVGNAVKAGDKLYFIKSGQLYMYDSGAGAWSTSDPKLGPDCEFRQKDGRCYIVSLANGNASLVSGSPLGPIEPGLAVLPNINGRIVTLSNSTSAFGLIAGGTRVPSSLDSFTKVSLDMADLSSDWYQFADGTVLVPSLRDKQRLYLIQGRGEGVAIRTLSLPFRREEAVAFQVGPDEIMFVNLFNEREPGLSVHSDGMVSSEASTVLHFERHFPVSVPSSTLEGWARLPDQFVHRASSRTSFNVLSESGGLKYRDDTWYVDVVGVEEGRPLVLSTREILVELSAPETVSLIDPSFKPATDFHDSLGKGPGIDINIGGRLVKRWHPSRTIPAGEVAAVDDVAAMGADDKGNIYVIDRIGGVWMRRYDQLSRRIPIGDVLPGSRFYLHGTNPRDSTPKLAIMSDSELLEVSDSSLVKVAVRPDSLWESISQVSRVIGGLSCDWKQGRGFVFVNPHGLKIGLSDRGWNILGAAVDYDLVLHPTHGPVVRLKGARFEGREGDGYLRVDQPLSLASIQPLASADIKARPNPLAFKVGPMSFTPGTSGWSVRSDNGHVHRFRVNGGLSVDYLDRVSTVPHDGKTHLVHSTGELGEVIYREWTTAGLGDPIKLANPYGVANPKDIFRYKNDLYLIFGSNATKWAKLDFSGATPALVPIESKIPEWALGNSLATRNAWSLRAGGVLERSDGKGGWDQMHYATDGGFRLACDDPEWSVDSVRSDGQGGVLYRTAQSANGSAKWYLRTMNDPEPRLFKDAIPARYEPRSQHRLGQAVFSRTNPSFYKLQVEAETHEFKLEVGDGIRLPHARPMAGASFIVQQSGLLLPTARTADGRQLHAFIDPVNSTLGYTLVPPGPAPERVRPPRERAAVINSDGLMLTWDASGSLHLESRDGLRFRLGKADKDKSLAYDGAATVRPLKVTSEEVLFATAETAGVALRLPRSGFEDLRNASLVRLGAPLVDVDIFAASTAESVLRRPEILAIGPAGRPIAAEAHPSIVASSATFGILRISADGHEIPLHVPGGKSHWSLPMDDVVAAHKTATGDYLVQSMEGRWLAVYGANKQLRKGLLLDSDLSSARLHTQPQTWVSHLRKGDLSIGLGETLVPGPSYTSPKIEYEVTEGTSLVLTSGHLYGLKMSSIGSVYRGQDSYPGSRFSAAYANGSTSFTLLDDHGSRLSVDQVYQATEAAPRPIQRVFGKLSADGVGSTSCARWQVSFDGKNYDVSAAQRPALDGDGVPYVDRVMGVGVTDGELAVDLGSHVVRLGATGVRGFFLRDEPVRTSLSIRYLRHQDTKESALEVQGFASPLINSADGQAIGATTAYHVPCADIPLRRISFIRPMGGGAIQLLQSQTYDTQDRRHLYRTGNLFSGSQLSIDRVNALVSRDGRVSLSHEPDAGGSVPQIPTVWSGCRTRGGPQQAIDTLGDLSHPWSEPREWRIEQGTLHWHELGYRWGD